MGASTPHFALQIRNRIRTLIAGLPADHPARRRGRARDRPARRARARLASSAAPIQRARAAEPPASVDRGPERLLPLLEPERARRRRARRRLPRPARPSDAPRSTGADPEPDAQRRRAAHLRALVAARARPRVQGRVRARAWPTSTASPACCSALVARRRRARRGLRHRQLHAATSRARSGRTAWWWASTCRETMLARAVEDTRRAGLEQVAYVRGDARSCRSWTRASTPSAASRRSTCSPTRCARSTA